MLISEFIDYLKDIQDVHGDLQIVEYFVNWCDDVELHPFDRDAFSVQSSVQVKNTTTVLQFDPN